MGSFQSEIRQSVDDATLLRPIGEHLSSKLAIGLLDRLDPQQLAGHDHPLIVAAHGDEERIGGLHFLKVALRA